MAFETIRSELADRILTITLARPERLNAFTRAMQRELICAFDDADANDDVRVVIVTGEGRGFCAGADLGSGGGTFDASGHEGMDDHRDGGGLVTLRIFESRKPVIGAINGPAVGIGATMTLPMDVRLASDRARMGFVFARRGIVPEAASSWFLPRLVGIAQAMEGGDRSRPTRRKRWPGVPSRVCAARRPSCRPRARDRDRGEHQRGLRTVAADAVRMLGAIIRWKRTRSTRRRSTAWLFEGRLRGRPKLPREAAALRTPAFAGHASSSLVASVRSGPEHRRWSRRPRRVAGRPIAPGEQERGSRATARMLRCGRQRGGMCRRRFRLYRGQPIFDRHSTIVAYEVPFR